jgi:hypothetical protein
MMGNEGSVDAIAQRLAEVESAIEREKRRLAGGDDAHERSEIERLEERIREVEAQIEEVASDRRGPRTTAVAAMRFHLAFAGGSALLVGIAVMAGAIALGQLLLGAIACLPLLIGVLLLKRAIFAKTLAELERSDF